MIAHVAGRPSHQCEEGRKKKGNGSAKLRSYAKQATKRQPENA